MSQSSATKLVSKLRFKINERRRFSNPDGPVGRQNKIKKTITALFKHERIEMTYPLADESRGYAERLISDAIRHGDCHKPTMEMASYWITEKPIIHKLFKVLAPRYKDLNVSYTKLWRAPNVYPGHGTPKCILELRNNIYPPLEPDTSYNKNLIHNVLLEEAKKQYRREKAKNKLQTDATASEQSNLSGNEVKQSDVQKASPAADGTVDSEKMSMTETESEIENKENLKADSDGGSESLGKNKVNASEVELDLNKINIKEEKQTESSSDVERK